MKLIGIDFNCVVSVCVCLNSFNACEKKNVYIASFLDVLGCLQLNQKNAFFRLFLFILFNVSF